MIDVAPIDYGGGREYRILAKIKNNRLWETMRRQFPKCRTQKDFARRLGTSQQNLCALLSMKRWPYNARTGCWAPLAVKIARKLRETEEYLFDQEYYGRQPEPVELVVSAQQMRQLEARSLLALSPARPDEVFEETLIPNAVDDALRTLLPREERILRLRFGFEGEEQNLDQVGYAFAVTRERARQIEAKALRKLRNPQRARILRRGLEDSAPPTRRHEPVTTPAPPRTARQIASERLRALVNLIDRRRWPAQAAEIFELHRCTRELIGEPAPGAPLTEAMIQAAYEASPNRQNTPLEGPAAAGGPWAHEGAGA